MNHSSLPLGCLLIFLQISSSLCTLSEVWEKLMIFSCDFSSEVEKFIPKDTGRSRRSILDEDPNFDDPEELFAYLYPLADLKPDDLLQEAQRSSSAPYKSNSIYAWATDLGTLWMNECRIRSGGENHDDDTAEDVEVEEESELKGNQTLSKRQGRSVHAEDENPGGGNYTPRNMINGHKIVSTFQNSREFNSSHGVYSQPSSGHQIKIQNTNGTSSKPRRKRPQAEALDRKLVRTHLSPSNVTTTTAAPDTTTTAAPVTSDDNFFSSYGGDIEYFFPLISFGIPFDGEITFLGFHGFKGLFPYK